MYELHVKHEDCGECDSPTPIERIASGLAQVGLFLQSLGGLLALYSRRMQ